MRREDDKTSDLVNADSGNDAKKKWNDHLLSEWNGRMREDETRIRSCPSDIMTLDRQITSTTGSTHESGDGSYGSRNRKV